MDVAFGATDVQFPRRFVVPLRRSWIGLFSFALILSFVFFFWKIHFSYALGENQPIHFSGDKQLWDRKANRVELFGHAAVNQVGETLTANYILLDLNARTMDATGDCVYIVADTVIWGEEMHFNLDTRTGTVVGGRVSTDSWTLRGERINKLGPGRFQTHWGTYSTCHDCPASWNLQGEDVDMTLDGYAYLTNVVTRIKDAPTFWSPYFAVPMKTHRQSGFIAHPFGASASNGSMFVLPYFWAIDRSADMTFGAGIYSARGNRFEWEGRYALSPTSFAKANYYYLTDKTFPVNRWAFDIQQVQDLPYGIMEKLRFTELSDNIYPFQLGDDVPRAGGEAVLPSNLSFSRGSSDVSAFVAFQRNRNLLNSTPGDSRAQLLQFDPRTVQALPTAVVTTNDKFLGDTPFIGGLSVGFSNFTRTSGPFDYDPSFNGVPFGTAPPPGLAPRPGIDPIREATRLSVTPSLYTSFRAFDVLSIVPSLQYRQYFYNFSNNIPNLNRGYLLFQTDLSTQLERIYDFPDDPDTPRAKHLIRPLLTYSFIPVINDNNGNPFVQQIKQNQPGRTTFTPGYNFDDNDIVPYSYQPTSANYFVPLGNSLAYGFTTQWIRRNGAVDAETPTYQNTAEFSAGQAINFLELTHPEDPGTPHIFTRLFSGLTLNYKQFTSQTTYYYYPDVFPVSSRSTISTGATYIFERSLHQRVLTYDRSISLGYTFNKVNGVTSNFTGALNYSLNDYILPTGTMSYGFEPTPQLYGASLGLALQSPSRCWKMTASAIYTVGIPGISYGLDLSLNLTGQGFGGVTELANQAGIMK